MINKTNKFGIESGSLIKIRILFAFKVMLFTLNKSAPLFSIDHFFFIFFFVAACKGMRKNSLVNDIFWKRWLPSEFSLYYYGEAQHPVSLSHFRKPYGAASVAPMWVSIVLSLPLWSRNFFHEKLHTEDAYTLYKVQWGDRDERWVQKRY